MKKIIILSIATMLVFTGCQQSAVTTESAVISSRDVVSEEKGVRNIEEQDTRSLEEILGQDIKKLSKAQLNTLKILYKEIATFDFNEDDSNEDEYYELLDNFDLQMMDFGLDVPFYSYGEVVEKYKDRITKKDIQVLEKLCRQYDEMMENPAFDYDSNEYLRLIDEIEKIFDNNNLPGSEITTQVENRSVHYALYEVSKGKIVYSENSMKEESALSSAEKELYNRLWLHIVKIIPANYMDKLICYELNTDGIDNVLAHVIEESDDYSKWRLAIDVKDAINPDGSFSDEFTNTVIHEFAHVMTLHKGELQGDKIVDTDAYETTEGYLKTKSYLNQFYKRFWIPIVAEHEAAVDSDLESGSDEAIYELYLKYEDQFVSDYAITNPVEDIAETYRVFVMEDKPVADTISNEKILFMYEYPELVKIRLAIRESLELE